MRWAADTGPGRGVRLYVRRVVEPTAPPVLLLHGLGVSGSVLQIRRAPTALPEGIASI